MKKRKFLVHAKVSFDSTSGLNIEFVRLSATLGQYNIRDSNNDFQTLTKTFLTTYFKIPNNNNFNLFIKEFLLPAEITFDSEVDSSISLLYPDFNNNLKKIIDVRSKEFFLYFELFKLSLISHSSYSIAKTYEEGDGDETFLVLPFSFSALELSLKSIGGMAMTFKDHLVFKSRKINFRRKNIIL